MGFLSSVSKLRGGNEYPDSSVAHAVIMIMISSGSMAAEEAWGILSKMQWTKMNLLIHSCPSACTRSTKTSLPLYSPVLWITSFCSYKAKIISSFFLLKKVLVFLLDRIPLY